MAWTEERVTLLKKLWAEGLSGKQVGDILGTTKNAVIGKLDRIRRKEKCINKDKAAAHKLSLERAERKKKLKKENDEYILEFFRKLEKVKPKPKIAKVAVAKKIVPISELETNQCRYPIDSQKGIHLFCGEGFVDKSKYPYCEEHLRMCFGPLSTNKKIKREAA